MIILSNSTLFDYISPKYDDFNHLSVICKKTAQLSYFL